MNWQSDRPRQRANEEAAEAGAWLVILAEFEVLLVVFGLVFGR